MERTTPMGRLGRLGRLENITAAVLFLVSPAAGWITGKVSDLALPGHHQCLQSTHQQVEAECKQTDQNDAHDDHIGG